ncbi:MULTISPECIES: antibiotic biosynthesis monooxygenase [unclassified Kitasatospora]|uniref:antibiotic biosynthesis monooxygenase n=1 Tax=unclassified Kitasatospora TaxID=2633591 RepID=UPI00070D69A0|nr:MULTISPECIES: antibiotic biosynthesis monooxygenase [unclassified Kitasatospora]KQV04687.1 hypothetical protein ASC99_14995 [Kitasatospora sp. Root107]KRB60789.1 hypothetical protein ASE03_10520 [Kitasatospora sp. Root187]
MTAPLYTRTAYMTGDPAAIDQALDGLRAEAVGLLSAQPGYRGFGLFADRKVGKIMMGSWWESEQARQASDEQLRDRRAALVEPFAGTVTVDNWEAAVFTPRRPAEPGAGFRMTRFDFDPGKVDLLINTVRDNVLPGLERIDGFMMGALFVNRTDGRGSVGAIFADLDASRGPQAALRAKAVAAAGVTFRSLEEFEVVLTDRAADQS